MADLAAAVPPVVAASPEVEIARDLARRAVPVGLVLVAISAVFWHLDGALTAAFAVAVIVVNFLASAAVMAWAARISPEMLMGTVLVGFVVRMGVIAVAVWAVKDQPWVVLSVLAFTLLAAQLVLLLWEASYVSGSLAYPGLKPKPAKEARHP